MFQLLFTTDFINPFIVDLYNKYISNLKIVDCLSEKNKNNLLFPPSINYNFKIVNYHSQLEECLKFAKMNSKDNRIVIFCNSSRSSTFLHNYLTKNNVNNTLYCPGLNVYYITNHIILLLGKES